MWCTLHPCHKNQINIHDYLCSKQLYTHVRGGAAGAAHAVVKTNGGLQTDASYRLIPLCSEAFTRTPLLLL